MALRVTASTARTTEFSIVAVTDCPPFLPMVFVETEAPSPTRAWPAAPVAGRDRDGVAARVGPDARVITGRQCDATAVGHDGVGAIVV